MKKIKLIYLSAALFLLLGISINADAFLLNTNMQDPSITAPNAWLEATFETNTNNTGSVTLTMSASGLTGNDYVSQWYFNLNGSYDPTKLTIEWMEGIMANSPVLTGTDSFKADGVGGEYDIRFDFPNNGDTFTSDDKSVYIITYSDADTLLPIDFEFGSVNGDYSFLSAAKIQGGNSPNWVSTAAVPIPNAIWLLSTGLIGLVIIKRRKIR